MGIGGVVVLLGGLARAGYITVDVPKIEKQVLTTSSLAAAIRCCPHTHPSCRTSMPHNQVLTMIDMNKDGKLDADDYKFASQRALTLLEANGKVAAGAFVAGFAYGFGARPVA